MKMIWPILSIWKQIERIQSNKIQMSTAPFISKLSNCTCCPRQCGVNRLKGEKGFCRIGADVPVSHTGLHFGEEPPISGTRGSGTIFFTGCNLRCVFCQNHQISQDFDPHSVRYLTTEQLADEMLHLQGKGAHNINFVSPSHVVFQMADAIILAREKGLSIPVVYNTNGYDSVESLRLIRGLVDIYLPDIKYMESPIARQFSQAGDYPEIIPDVLAEMLNQVGLLKIDDEGLAIRGVLVRHLVLPGCLENSKQCLSLLADLDPEISVSIMSQYSPQYQACRYPQINRVLTIDEYAEITDFALEIGLENAFIQEIESRDYYLPDFEREQPFEA